MTRKKLALTVGINDYPGSNNDLQGCVNDANDWSEMLMGRGYGVATLLDSDATKANMVEGIRKLLMDAHSGDSVVLTYSGHGTWVPDQNGDEPDHRDEALCPWDCITTGEVLTDDELFDLFATTRREGVHFLFVSDSCHSGSVSRFMGPLNPAPESSTRKVRFLPPEVFMRDDRDRLSRALVVEEKPKSNRRSRFSSLLLSGCKDDEYSYDTVFNGRPNGAFTYAALSALKSVLQECDTTSYFDWYTAIRCQLPSVDYPQTPLLSGYSEWKHWTPIF